MKDLMGCLFFGWLFYRIFASPAQQRKRYIRDIVDPQPEHAAPAWWRWLQYIGLAVLGFAAYALLVIIFN